MKKTSCYHATITAKFADAVVALNVADRKLGRAIAEFGDRTKEETCLDLCDLWGVRLNARIFARLLREAIGDAEPRTPARVFRELEQYDNLEWRNAPHTEGAALALDLAFRKLSAVLNMVNRLSGEEVDARFEVPVAAWSAIQSAVAILGSALLFYNGEDRLDDILIGGRRQTAAHV
jgi:hypothetical protein